MPNKIFIFDSHDLQHLKYFKNISSIYWVYDEIDKFPINYSLKDVLQIIENKMINKADYVLASSYSQYQKRITWNKNVIYFPNASSFKHFNKVATTTFAKPLELKRIKGKKVGFVGVFDRRLDIKLIQEVCERCRSINFIFIGPIKRYMEESVRELVKHTNVSFIPQKTHDELLPYLQHFNAVWIPYIVNDATNTMYPSKLQEYFASGKPVISTSISEIKRLIDFVYIAEDAENMCLKIKKALNEHKNSDFAQRRIAYAKANCQEQQLYFINGLINENK